jgi:hypothetical protein
MGNIREKSHLFGEHDGSVSQPGHGRAVGVERRFPQHRIVGSLVQLHHDTLLLDVNHSTCLHEPAVQLLRLRLLEAVELVRQPAVAAVRDHSQGDVEIDVGADFTGQAVEMEEVMPRAAETGRIAK